MWLTKIEKQRHLRELNWAMLAAEAGDEDLSVDAAFIPYLVRVNNIPWLCSTQCCEGHLAEGDIKIGHLVIRVEKDYLADVAEVCYDFVSKEYFTKVWLDLENYISVSVWFNEINFPFVVEKFIEQLEKIDYEKRYSNENQLQ